MENNYELWDLLTKHVGHNVEIQGNNPFERVLYCKDCDCVILDAGVETITTRTDLRNIPYEEEM
jgi:hypothetical protein